MKCRVDYCGNVEEGIVEVVDQIKHKVIVYLVNRRCVVAVYTWEVEEVNQKQRRLGLIFE